MDPKPDGPEFKKLKSLSISFKVDWDLWLVKLFKRKGKRNEDTIIYHATDSDTDRAD